MNSPEYFMEQAIALSFKTMRDGSGGPFGCVIVKDNEIIANGSNQVLATNDPTAHAEVVAIRNACNKIQSFQLTDCIIYTSCEPCPMCLGAIYWARPQAVFYANTKEDAANIGFDDQFIYEELDRKLHLRKLNLKQICRDKALNAFEEWAKLSNKTLY